MDRDLASTWLIMLLVFYSFPAFSGDLPRDAQAVYLTAAEQSWYGP